jgi:UDP-N-acetyl-D-glucosamine dehydrogenase
VSYHDPLVPRIAVKGGELTSIALSETSLASADCVVIHTDHGTFDYEWIVEHARLVFDTRNATRDVKAGRDRISRL